MDDGSTIYKKDITIKRYLVFSGSCGYECGGWKDLCATFDNIEEMCDYTKTLLDDTVWQWYHVVDTETMQIIQAGSS